MKAVAAPAPSSTKVTAARTRVHTHTHTPQVEGIIGFAHSGFCSVVAFGRMQKQQILVSRPAQASGEVLVPGPLQNLYYWGSHLSCKASLTGLA